MRRYSPSNTAFVLLFLVLFTPPGAVAANDPNKPLLFLGNHQLPPMSYREQGQDKTIGVVVDLAEAISKKMRRPVRFEYLDWSEAQQLVLDGKADALLQINPTGKRMENFDFSAPLLKSKFALFVPYENENIFSIKGLRGRKVGVEEKGAPIDYISKEPSIEPVIIPDVVAGIKLLVNNKLDAVVVDQWVGAYVLAEHHFRGIRIAGEPVAESESAIAVKKGNTELLAEIDQALAEIKRDGTYSSILAKWQPKELIFQTKSQYHQEKLLEITLLCAFILALILSASMYSEIRKRKKAEQRLRLFIEHAPASLAMFDREMRYLSVSRRWLTDYKLSERDLIGLSHYEVFPERAGYWREVQRRGLNGEVVTHKNDRFDRADGSVQWLRWEARPWHDHTGNIAGILVFTEDITAQKQSEEALRDERAKLTTVVENLDVGILILDARGVLQFMNTAALKMHGFGSSADMPVPYGQFWQSFEMRTPGGVLIPSEESPAKRSLNGEYFKNLELQFRDLRTGTHWIGSWSVSPVRNLADEVQLLVFTVQDITERKAAEGALQLSEEKFAKAFVSNPSAICLTGMADSRVVDANPAFTRIFGFPREEYTGRTILQLGLWPTPEDREAAVGELQREGFFRNRQQKMRTKYGEERDFLASAEAISIGDEPMIVSTWLDITDLKRTENELRESEQRFRLALKNAPVTVAAQDPDLRYIWAYNQRTARPEDIIDSFDRDIFTPEEAAHITAIKQRVLQENIELREQMWFNRPHGRIFLDVCWEPIHDPAGKVTGVASATVDLTPLKLAEEALQASLAEKEVLLKEVHHRVKNNMQVISSLVDLQADEVKDEAMRTIFQDLIYRVRAMAMVHEKLYKSVELAQVDFADYAQSLLRYLWQAQGALTSGIELNLHLKPVLLSVNASIPFGLILNEVFTNALKHAFKGRDRGAIVVSLGQEEGRLVHLEVGDDGIGLPPDLDWQNSRSLGLRLVNTLARQLHAETEITSAQGTRFALRFEKHERN